tara:strand:+ start:129 stop:599 length:471 start_codon:yes stop_codon:yes gene_type:complete
MSKELEKILAARALATQKQSFEQEKFRAQSIMVGRVGAGTTEVSLRGLDGDYLFILLHPTEVIELLHQLAANTGCTLDIRPRQDFASFREWPNSNQDEEKLSTSFPPHPKLVSDYNTIGSGDPTAGSSHTVRKKNESSKETMAVSKPKNTRRAERP